MKMDETIDWDKRYYTNFNEEYNIHKYYELRLITNLSTEDEELVKSLYRSGDNSNLIIAIEIMKSKLK